MLRKQRALQVEGTLTDGEGHTRAELDSDVTQLSDRLHYTKNAQTVHVNFAWTHLMGSEDKVKYAGDGWRALWRQCNS